MDTNSYAYGAYIYTRNKIVEILNPVHAQEVMSIVFCFDVIGRQPL